MHYQGTLDASYCHVLGGKARAAQKESARLHAIKVSMVALCAGQSARAVRRAMRRHL
jgi:hypothetical protein